MLWLLLGLGLLLVVGRKSGGAAEGEASSAGGWTLTDGAGGSWDPYGYASPADAGWGPGGAGASGMAGSQGYGNDVHPQPGPTVDASPASLPRADLSRVLGRRPQPLPVPRVPDAGRLLQRTRPRPSVPLRVPDPRPPREGPLRLTGGTLPRPMGRQGQASPPRNVVPLAPPRGGTFGGRVSVPVQANARRSGPTQLLPASRTRVRASLPLNRLAMVRP